MSRSPVFLSKNVTTSFSSSTVALLFLSGFFPGVREFQFFESARAKNCQKKIHKLRGLLSKLLVLDRLAVSGARGLARTLGSTSLHLLVWCGVFCGAARRERVPHVRHTRAHHTHPAHTAKGLPSLHVNRRTPCALGKSTSLSLSLSLSLHSFPPYARRARCHQRYYFLATPRQRHQ